MSKVKFNLRQFFKIGFDRSKERQQLLDEYFELTTPTVDYLLNISQKHHFLYVETPKVACSTIKKTLQKIELNDSNTPLPQAIHDKHNSPLLSPSDLKKSELQKVLQTPDYFRFSFVRNPFSRIVSAFLEKVANDYLPVRVFHRKHLGFGIEEEVTFLDFLQVISKQTPRQMDIHWCPQSSLLAYTKIDYDFIGRFENFDPDFQMALKRILKSEDTDTASLLQTANRHKVKANQQLKKYLSPEAIAIIQKVYQKDFENFGYTFEPEFISE